MDLITSYARLQFNKKAHFEKVSAEEIIISDSQWAFSQGALKWKSPSRSLQKCIEKLKEGITESDLCDEWLASSEDEDSLPFFFYELERLRQRNWLDAVLYWGKDPFLLLHCYPNCDRKGLAHTGKEPKSFQLSRFAYLYTREGEWVCKTALADGVEIHLRHALSASLIASLAKPHTLSSLSEQFPALPQEVLETTLSLLSMASCLRTADENPALQTWEFHDLLFHTTSRSMNSPHKVGGTFRFEDLLPPLPALRSLPNQEGIPLYRPNMSEVAQKDLPFSEVLENRKSIREPDEAPMTSQQLGEFLFRSARVKEVHSGGKYEVVRRPYPGGGACHELELYPLIHHCEGVEKGLYYYHPHDHMLYRKSEWNAHCQKLLQDAMRSQGGSTFPHVLILITARFRRVSWKYETMAYAVMLKNTGVLLQTMYLVATAMQLAPCAVGAGDSEVFTKLVDADFFDETTIGEFTLSAKKVGVSGKGNKPEYAGMK